MISVLLILTGVALGGGAIFLAQRLFGARAKTQTIQTHTVFEQVRAVGRLVGMEVRSKEIATSTKGYSWMPPIILSQARVAMIFQFEKQFSVDLSRLRREDVTEIGPGVFRLMLPPLEGALRLLDVVPYDIQAGRVLGLLDIIQVNAATQGELMKKAQSQAAELYTANDAKYEQEAQRSIERQVHSFLSLFDIRVETAWRRVEPSPPLTAPAAPESNLAHAV